MTYQEARRLRGTGLLDLAAQNIALGNGVIGSLGSAMSSKFKAKVTGIKESFDPLNIAKKLTRRTSPRRHRWNFSQRQSVTLNE